MDKRVETIERQQASINKKLDRLIHLMSSVEMEDFVVASANLLYTIYIPCSLEASNIPMGML